MEALWGMTYLMSIYDMEQNPENSFRGGGEQKKITRNVLTSLMDVPRGMYLADQGFF